MAGNLAKLLNSVVRSLSRRDSSTPKPTKPGRPTKPGTPAKPGAPSADADFSGVRVEYNPDLDGDADPGEVVWTWVPWEEDPTQGKDRPVLIVGRRGSMLVGVALTSKHHDNEIQVPVGTGPWDSQGRPSYAKIERVLDVDPSQIRREGAILGKGHFDDVIAALRRAG